MIGSGSRLLASTFSDRRTRKTELAIMRIVVTGASGQVGSYLIDTLTRGPFDIVAWSSQRSIARGEVPVRPVDLTDHRAVAAALTDADPDVLIHLAAVSSTDAARQDPRRCEALNIEATRFLAEWAAKRDRRLIYTSTDLVFDGLGSWYREDDPARPMTVYGQSKHAAERFVLDVPAGLVARLSLLYGPSRSGKDGYFDRATAALRAGTPQAFFADEHRTPLDYASASMILARLALSEARGLLHLGGPERLSRFELMRRAGTALGIDSDLVKSNHRSDAPSAEPRPADVSLDSSRLGQLFPDLECPRVEDALAVMS
jgi:dTDP-4-dehydrorhamnose reductase